MDPFSSLDCLVADDVITESKADSLRSTAQWLHGLQKRDLLMYLAAHGIISGRASGEVPITPTGPVSVLDWYPALGSFASVKGPTPAFSRASGATMIDVNGNVVWGPENLIRYSDNINGPTWAAANDASIAGNVITFPSGVSGVTHTLAADAGGDLVYSIQFAASDAGKKIKLYLSNGGIVNDLAIDSTGLVVFIFNTTPIYAITISNEFAGTPKTLTFIKAQLERSKAPRAYIPTTSAPVYGPRITYDPVTHKCLGYLAEEQRTNDIIFSNTFTDVIWIKEGSMALTPSVSIGPDGTTSATKIQNATLVQSGIRQAIIHGGPQACSIFVKAGTTSVVQLLVNGNAERYANFNIATGVIGSSGTDASPSIKSFGNGWYKISIAVSDNSSSFYILIGGSMTSAYYSAAVTTGDVYIWGAQVEQGSFPTSYIPTTSAAATRSADVCQIGGADFLSFYNQSEGTIVFEGIVPVNIGGGNPWCLGETAQYEHLLIQPTLDPFWQTHQQATITSTLNDPFTPKVKHALGFTQSEMTSSVNGSPINSAAVHSRLTVTHMGIGNNFLANASWINGTIARIQYFNTRLPNEDLVTLTEPATPAGAIVHDSFIGSGQLAGRMPSPVSAGSVWETFNGASSQAILSGGQAIITRTSGANGASIVNCGASDGVISAWTTLTAGAALAIYFRVTDSLNNWMFYFDGGSAYVFLTLAGSGNSIGPVAISIPAGTKFEAKVVISGVNISTFINGIAGPTAVHGHNSTATKHGIGVSGSDGVVARFDNFTLTP